MSRWGARQWRTLALLCASQFMLVLDTSIVSVALPAVQDDLGLSQGDLQWVVSAYTLVFGGFLLLGGRTGDLVGRRGVFAGGLALFTLASLLGGLAPSAGVLVAARALQGLGAAAVTPAALSLLLAAFPDGPGRARALGVWGGALSLGLCAGVLLGGILTDAFGWRWVMLVNVPLGASAAVVAPFLLQEEPRRASPGRLDVAGAASATLGLFALVYGLSGVGRDTPALWFFLAFDEGIMDFLRNGSRISTRRVEDALT